MAADDATLVCSYTFFVVSDFFVGYFGLLYGPTSRTNFSKYKRNDPRDKTNKSYGVFVRSRNAGFAYVLDKKYILSRRMIIATRLK